MTNIQTKHSSSGSINNKGVKIMLVLIIVGMMVTMLNQSIINIALPQIMTQFNVTANSAQWLSTGYMLINGILIPVSAYLIHKFSYKQIFITAIVFFIVGSFISAVSPSFTILLVGRLIQAVGGGLIVPLGMNVFMLAFPIEKRGAAMGIIGLGIILAPSVGPTICGYVIQYFNWNVLFYSMTIFAVCILALSLLLFKYDSKRANVKLDILGTILSTAGFGALLYGVSEAGANGWSSTVVIVSLAISAVSLLTFIIYELKKTNPLLDLRIFKDFNFTFSLIINAIITVVLYAGMIILPLFLENVRGYSALQAGLLILPGSLITGFLGLFTGKLFDKIGIKPLALIGLSIMTVALLLFSRISMSTSYTSIMLLYMLECLGISFIMMPISSSALMTISEKDIPNATALTNTLRTVAGAIGSSVLIVVMTNSAKNYLINLGTQITQSSITLASLHGINVTFLVTASIGAVALVLSIFFKTHKTLKESTVTYESKK